MYVSSVQDNFVILSHTTYIQFSARVVCECVVPSVRNIVTQAPSPQAQKSVEIFFSCSSKKTENLGCFFARAVCSFPGKNLTPALGSYLGTK